MRTRLENLRIEMGNPSDLATHQVSVKFARLPFPAACPFGTHGRMSEPPDVEPEPARVVVVEDDADNLALMVALLGSRYDTAVCDDGRQALPTIARHRPHVVLLDLGLPHLDG